MVKKKIAQSGSLDKLREMLNEFYYTDSIALHPISDKQYSVHNSKGIISGATVEVSKRRGMIRYTFYWTE